MTHLSDEDLEWGDVYEVGDTVLFVSNLGNNDIMTVTKQSLYNNRCPVYFSTGSGPDYYANTGYRYIIQHRRSVIDGLISFRKSITDSLEVIYMLGMRFSISDLNRHDTHRLLKTSKFWHNSELYDNCIIADSKNSEYPDYWEEKIKNKVEEFVWSKEYGLIYYKFEDGEEFFREDLLPDALACDNQ
ncbi:hypothetical protein [Muribaculum intestinale]|uniref:hypothetical protein n=1 Tax=Muribaculum intestinale TaxID=1796646 RepID=UPI00241C4FAC|nr:hypothetical protein [Muribaculum intestinale]